MYAHVIYPLSFRSYDFRISSVLQEEICMKLIPKIKSPKRWGGRETFRPAVDHITVFAASPTHKQAIV